MRLKPKKGSDRTIHIKNLYDIWKGDVVKICHYIKNFKFKTMESIKSWMYDVQLELKYQLVEL